ncbi:hypothetical protein ABW20_dc0102401 [Dactylellina cionopaga]|nr:hypothetical protein ABW20_dc0102401 [Dactylellina cionopaga]
MADVEVSVQQEGRVAVVSEQVMTPCPSPDEAVRFAGDEAQREPETTKVVVKKIPDEQDIPVLAPKDGPTMTADDHDHTTLSANRSVESNAYANPTTIATSPTASASTLNSEDNPILINDDDADNNVDDASETKMIPSKDDPQPELESVVVTKSTTPSPKNY